jgi:hypothetical protein
MTRSQLVKKSSAFYWTRLFTTLFTKPHQLSIFWVRSIQYINCPPFPLTDDSFQYYPPIYAWIFQVVSFPLFLHQNLHTPLNSPIRAKCTSMSFFSIWSPEQYCVNSTDIKAPHFVVLSTSVLFFPHRPKYSPHHPIRKHPQPTFIPQCEWPSFSPIQSIMQKYSSVYLNLYNFR